MVRIANPMIMIPKDEEGSTCVVVSGFINVQTIAKDEIPPISSVQVKDLIPKAQFGLHSLSLSLNASFSFFFSVP